MISWTCCSLPSFVWEFSQSMFPCLKRFAAVKCSCLALDIVETLGTELQTPSRLKKGYAQRTLRDYCSNNKTTDFTGKYLRRELMNWLTRPDISGIHLHSA